MPLRHRPPSPRRGDAKCVTCGSRAPHVLLGWGSPSRRAPTWTARAPTRTARVASVTASAP
eukprot:1042363-Prymnesium_polylepis.1